MAPRRPDDSPTPRGKNDSPREPTLFFSAHDPHDVFRPKHCLHCRAYPSGVREDGYMCHICRQHADPAIKLTFEFAAHGICATCHAQLTDDEREAHLYIGSECDDGRDRHVSSLADAKLVHTVRSTRPRDEQRTYIGQQTAQMISLGRCSNLQCARSMSDEDLFNLPVGRGYRYLYCISCRAYLLMGNNPTEAFRFTNGPSSPSELAPDARRPAHGEPSEGVFAPGDPFGNVPALEDHPVPAVEDSPEFIHQEPQVPYSASEASTNLLPRAPSPSPAFDICEDSEEIEVYLDPRILKPNSQTGERSYDVQELDDPVSAEARHIDVFEDTECRGQKRRLSEDAPLPSRV
ncbi:hypothetical protein QQZ08_011342 [Neonectria magnoliae]|uniref:Uncharacterized protein n=1 Tax=Neonectria magnoliae TaxID=2732573 RepID=A0ABR1HBF7_9HYPO